MRGYAATDALLAQTFEFSRLPFTVAIAYVAFGETIDIWTWIGALIIFASAVYITRREAQLRQAERPSVCRHVLSTPTFPSQRGEPPRMWNSVISERCAPRNPHPSQTLIFSRETLVCGVVASHGDVATARS